MNKLDLISRADAIEVVRHSKSYVIFKEAIVVDKNEVVEKLTALPSADAEIATEKGAQDE